MFSKLFASTFAVLMVTSVPAIADQMGPNGDKFYEEAAHFENACMTGDCSAPYVKKLVYDQKTRLNKLDQAALKTLKAVAFSQAQIWGDTILEGDYHSAGHTRLDGAIAYYKEDALIGYKIQYSEKAWYTGDCSFDGEAASLKDCQEGRIVEGSYVSADGQTFFSDESKYAEFNNVLN